MEVPELETLPAATQPPTPELSWSALLAAYRLGPKERWSGLLVESLGPWLTNARKTLLASAPYLDDEDIAQELVLEVLAMAERWDPHCDDCWIPRRLVEYAEDQVRGSLKRERRNPGLELTDEIEAPPGEQPEVLFDTPLGLVAAADLQLIQRVKVLGEPVEILAAQAGITPRQMRQRVRNARLRAQAAIRAGDGHA